MYCNASWVAGAEAFIVTVATLLGKFTWTVSTNGKAATACSTLRPQFSMHNIPATRRRRTLLLLLLLLLLHLLLLPVVVGKLCGRAEAEVSVSGTPGRGMVNDGTAGCCKKAPTA
jgi:hypothetical protein